MVKRTITITTILLVMVIAVCLIIALNRASFAADDDIASGTSGTCTWVIDKDGVLTISPTDGVSGILDNTANDNIESAKWYQYRDSITKVLVNAGVKVNSTGSFLFYGLANCTEMVISNLDTSNVTKMNGMFWGCSSLTNLDITSFNTSNVTDMSCLFLRCNNLANIDVTRFDTRNVTNMNAVFYYCSNLTTLDVTGFNTSKVTDMSHLFMGCNHLRTIDVTGFDTSNVVDMNSMFRECTSLTTLDVARFNTSNVTEMFNLFNGCSSLTTLNLTGFDTSNANSMDNMFTNCKKLSNIVLGENFDFSGNNISPISYQAVLPTPPATITTGKWIRDDKEYGPYTSGELRDNYTSNMAGTWVWEPADNPFAIFDETTKTLCFVRAKELHDNGTIGNVHSISGSDYSGKIFVVNETSTSINRTWASVAAQVKKIQFIDEIKPRSVEEWFFNFTECEEIDVTKLNTENTISLRRLFRDCQKITSLDLSNFNTSNVTSMMQLFNHCYLLENVNVSSFDTSKVTSMDGMFSICRNLSSLDVTNFRTENVTDMAYMFQNLKCINELDLSNFDTSKVTRMTKMFDNGINMSKIILSSNFSFKGKNISAVSDQSILPLPLEESPYTDRWIREDGAYGPYTPEELRENYDGSTMAGTWIRERKRLTVTYNYTGTIPQGASSLPETRTYLAGEEVTVASDATAPGYTFSGWSRTGTFTMPIENLEITGSFTANTDTPYKVEHYLEDLTEGTYTLTKTDNLTGTTDTAAQAIAKDYEGFTFDESIVGTNLSGTISADGSLVLKLYYKRNSYNVTYAYTGEIPNDASSLPQSQNFKYGAEIIVPEEATAEGYTFSGWIKDYITMPAQDIEITGYFIEKPKSYNYKIEYYFDGEIDSSLEEILNAEEDMEISLYPQSSIKHKGTFYTLVSENHKITICTNEEENVIKVYYETDVLDYEIDNPEDTKEGDGIPDKYQIQIFYKVENGSWDNGTKGTKTNIVTLRDKDGKYAEKGRGKLTIPQVGNKPAEGYSKGSWNAEIPEVVSNKDNGKEFIYSYTKIGSISKIKGNLANPKTDDIVQSYALYGAIAILLMLVAKRTINKYSRKKRKIQF